ncbi:hypothetical protein ACFRFH_12165 [Leifsonia sp. NPDC056824]|uniref:hypothetical protein n=1 Tax=Leifsonia sp. NPDC056824 TaxID=3345953 RepID=UPI0036B76FDE
MSARVWPADSVDTDADGVVDTPSFTGRWLRQTALAAATGVASGSRPLGAASGVRPGTPNTIVTATSTTWTVTPFGGVIDGESSAIAGAYGYAFDQNVTGSVTAAGGSARTDRLDVQISDHAESDGTGATTPPNVAIIYTAGGPGLAAAPARSHALAQINVPASGGGSPTVTWSADYTVGAGGVRPFTLLTALTSWTPAVEGQLAYANDTDNLWIYVQGAPTPGWYHVAGRPLTSTFSGGTFGGVTYAGSGTHLETRGGYTSLDGLATSTSAGFVAATTYQIGTIPTAFAPAATTSFACTSNVTAVANVTISSAGVVTITLNVGFTGALNLSLAGCTWRTKGLT